MGKVIMEEDKALESIQSEIWKVWDVFRAENIRIDDYYVGLLFLSLKRNNLLPNETPSSCVEFYIRLRLSIKNSNNEAHQQYLPIISAFESTIRNFGYRGLTEVIQTFNELNTDLLAEKFSEIFDHVLYRISSSQGRHGGEVIQPIELTKFLINLADLPDHASIFNPFAGLASFGVFLNRHQHYFGQELNPITWSIGQLRIFAYDRAESSQFVCVDSVENWPNPDELFDLIISHPPFINFSFAGRNNSSNKLPERHRSYESFLIDQGIQLLNRNGKLIAILPQGFLFRGDQEKLRKNLVNDDLLDTIISLPGGVLSNTGIPIIILVISRQKTNPNLIRLIDASNLIIKSSRLEKVVDYTFLKKLIDSPLENSDNIRIVSREEIAENEFNLTVPRYFQKNIDGVKLKNLLGDPLKGRRVNHLTEGKLVRIKDLKDDKVEFNLEVSKLESIDLRHPQIRQINESCLLLATRWRTLKPTWFEYQNDPIFFRFGDIQAFPVKEDLVDISFLINELQAEYVQEQVAAFRVGSTIPYIRIEDLLEVVVKIPSLEAQNSLDLQRAKFEGVKEEALKAKEKEADFLEQLKESIEKQSRDFHSLKHTIRQYLSPLKSNVSGTRKFLKNNEGNAITLDMIYSKNLNQTLDEHLLSIGGIIDSINILLLGHEIKSFKNGKSDLIELIQNCQRKFKQEEIFTFTEPEIDEESLQDSDGNFIRPIIGLSEDQFESLFSNIIDNAKNHGFKGKRSGNLIKVGIKYEDRFLILTISNTGHPFEKGFTKKHLTTLGEKTIDSLGTGIGGAEINKIVDSAGGSFDIYSDPEAELYKVSYIFKFPFLIEE